MPYANLETKRAYDRDYGNERRDARRARCRAWREKNPDRNRAIIRRHRLNEKYRMSPEAYDALLARQDGVCAICGSSKTSRYGYFCIDHCHKTGIVRGLLCRNCNTSIGQAGDSPEILRKAITYLEAKCTP